MENSYFVFIAFSLFFTLASAEVRTGPGPADLDRTELSRLSSNATGSTKLLSTLNDATSFSSGAGSASLNVTEVPFKDQVITNSVISLNAPGEGLTDDPLWDTCAIVFTNVFRAATVKGQKDEEGDCKVTLGEKCISALTYSIGIARVQSYIFPRNLTAPCGGMILPTIPAECQSALASTELHQSLTKNETDGAPWIYEASEPHPASNLTSYKVATTKIWPIVFTQGPKNGFDSSGTTTTGMSCLKVKSVSAGSTAIGDVPGAASKLGSGISGVLGLAVAGLLLLV